jgi:hypothetical protein
LRDAPAIDRRVFLVELKLYCSNIPMYSLMPGLLNYLVVSGYRRGWSYVGKGRSVTDEGSNRDYRKAVNYRMGLI